PERSQAFRSRGPERSQAFRSCGPQRSAPLWPCLTGSGCCLEPRMTLRRPRRLAGFSYRGRYRYLLTFCTAHRAPLFTRSELVQTALARIQQTAGEERFSVRAYCFMPDHLHLIVEGLTEDADL